GLLKRIKTLL
uniref:Anoplin n=1 Tax=Anoplius samariensis TaxID=200614 RepID=ANOP_ANOSM|nr:RecName: Full=Anoplin; Short=ANP; AltName: Full=As-183 [Anoplius samariensis]